MPVCTPCTVEGDSPFRRCLSGCSEGAAAVLLPPIEQTRCLIAGNQHKTSLRYSARSKPVMSRYALNLNLQLRSATGKTFLLHIVLQIRLVRTREKSRFSTQIDGRFGKKVHSMYPAVFSHGRLVSQFHALKHVQ